MAKSPAYPKLEGLVDLACRNGVDIRPTLLRVLTDLYVQKPTHTVEEEIQYIELAQRLIDTVDASTRTAVAATLAAYPYAPLALVRQIRHHTEMAGMPADPEPATVSAPLSVAAQGGAAAAELCDLFFAASADERRLILTNLDFAARPARPDPVANTTDAIRRLENAALQHNAGAFARELENCLGLSRRQAGRIVEDQSGEPIVIVAKALAMPGAVLQRILLFLNPAVGQSVQRVYDLALLYDQITPAAAASMVAIWRQAEPRNRGAHQPLYWDDERTRARRSATPAQYHLGDHAFEELPPPFKIGVR